MTHRSNPTAAIPLPIKLATPLDPSALRGIERQLHLRFNKWDTQVGDVSVLCEHPLVLPSDEWDFIRTSAEALATETELLESIAIESPSRLFTIGVPRAIRKVLQRAAKLRAAKPPAWNGMRSMRFDFHPTASGWRVSEVNSDVPGGWREGTSLPRLYQPFYTSLDCPDSPLDAWGSSIQTIAPNGHIALLSAPGYLEDQQVLQTFRIELESRRIASTLIQTPAALDWTHAGGCKLAGSRLAVSAVIRFYQLEWLCALPASTQWMQRQWLDFYAMSIVADFMIFCLTLRIAAPLGKALEVTSQNLAPVSFCSPASFCPNDRARQR